MCIKSDQCYKEKEAGKVVEGGGKGPPDGRFRDGLSDTESSDTEQRPAWQTPAGRVFLAEGTAYAKALGG